MVVTKVIVSYSTTRQLILAALFTALTAIGALIHIPFPLVPLTLQTLFTVLAGSLLYPRWAVLSQTVYLILGLIGLPVFAGGGGPSTLLSPSFGYLIAFPVVAGWISWRVHRHVSFPSFYQRLGIHLSGLMLLLFIGSVWLYLSTRLILQSPLSPTTAISAGFLIFVPGECVKAVLSAWFVHALFCRF